MKKPLKKIQVALLILLFSSFTLNLIPTSLEQTTSTIVSVSPSSITIGEEGQLLPKSFTINVNVTDVTDLFAWQIYLYYSPRVLNLTSAIIPAGHVFDGKASTEIDQDIETWRKTISNLTSIDFANITGTSWVSDVETPYNPPPPRRQYNIVKWVDKDNSDGLTTGDIVFITPNLPASNEFYFIDGIRFDGSTIRLDISVAYLGWGGTLLGTESTFNGSGTLCQANFNAIRPGNRSFNFSQSTTLLDSDVAEMSRELGSGSVTVRGIPAQKDPSSISIDIPETVEIGSTVTISGAISPLRIGATVKIEYGPSGGTLTQLTEIQTTQTSSYSVPWNPSDSGKYDFKASWAGDDVYTGASATATITITKGGEGPATPLSDYLIYIVIIVVIIIVVVGFYFLRIKKKS